jgi:hypothetical protein
MEPKAEPRRPGQVHLLVSATQMTKISHLTDQGPLTRDPNVDIFIYVSIVLGKGRVKVSISTCPTDYLADAM